MKRLFQAELRLWGGALLAALLVGGCASELGVYTLCSYEGAWKGGVCVGNAYDPYYDFWDEMTAGSGDPYADPDDSERFRNSEVHTESVLPLGGSFSGWDGYDMVFFYGHNNTIVPPHPHHWFDYSTYSGGVWSHHSGYLDTIGWGHTTNYDYWATRPVNDAHIHPGAVTYLYHQYTSNLIGGNRDFSGGSLPWRRRWNDPLQYETYGKLGEGNLEWLILHGCQAVITADLEGEYNRLALDVFAPVHGRWHIVLGHYESYTTNQLQPLSTFAYDLLAGVPVQTAYFDTDPDNNTSAIAAETTPFTWSGSVMVNDRWDDPMGDFDGSSIFSQRWIVPLGTTESHWGSG